VGANGKTNHGTYGTTANGTHYATGAYGGVAASNNGRVAYGNVNGGAYYGGGNHPPAVVNQYYGAGCYNCGGWNGGAVAAGVVAGAVVGTAVAATANANAAAYAYTVGNTYPVLPAACVARPYGGVAYYSCGGPWMRPYYGANGTYYRVVAAPY
jgi:hypothetical protein